MTETVASNLLEYYKSNRFNPVLIPLENEEQWRSHLAKRCNLYEKHLGIPMVLLNGRSVLEFGPNSGENALVLAKFGANLTLVEPNEQVIPRIEAIFDQFGLTGRIKIINSRLEDFDTNEVYDMVIAEGFLSTLDHREDALRRIGNYVSPGSFGVISFNDLYGGFLEMLRRLVLFRACNLSGVHSVHGQRSLAIAKSLYFDDFARLPASRNFESWWKDTLVNPFYHSKYLWSYLDVLPILAEVGADFHSSSPMWSTFKHYTWYKKLDEPCDRLDKIRANWHSELPYFLTGMVPTVIGFAPSDDVIIQLERLMQEMSELTRTEKFSGLCPAPPQLLLSYLKAYPDVEFKRFSTELAQLFKALNASKAEDLIQAYRSTVLLKQMWGTPYHYLCFQKLL